MSTNPFDKQAPIKGIKHILMVGSGKGGVGKSAVAANLALSLKAQGKTVGLLDADIYGPSVPRMFGSLNQPPKVDENHKIEPIVRHGLRLMSIGFLIDESSAVVWRGPMLFKAIDQFLNDVQWGELDYLVIDLPPGTGDVALTLAQKTPVDGAVIVCTPQNLALVDAKKALDMFQRINVPVLGMVENMSYLPMPDGTQKALFPKGDLRSFADAKKLDILGEIPFLTEIGMSAEAGIPFVVSASGSDEVKAFTEIANKITTKIEN